MLDSCTMQFPFSACEGFALDGMVHSPKFQGGCQISNMYTATSTSLPIGIKSIKVDMLNQYITIDASAKILLDKYLDGITINTFAQVIETINSTGYVLLDLEGCYNQGRFLKIDTTNNVHMGGYDNDLVGHWNSISPQLVNAINNNHFYPKIYSASKNKGIAFLGDQQVEKNRLIAYCKIVELQTAKNNEFMRALRNPMLMYNNAKDVLRIECNHTSFKSIKSRMQIGDILIKSVLSQGKNPNVWMLDKITQPNKANQLLLFLDQYPPDQYKFEMLIKIEGLSQLVRKANYCEATIKGIIKSYDCDFKYWWKGKRDFIGAEKLIAKLKVEDSITNNQTPGTNELILYIREQMLKVG
jgi:hypothetical protein